MNQICPNEKVKDFSLSFINYTILNPVLGSVRIWSAPSAVIVREDGI